MGRKHLAPPVGRVFSPCLLLIEVIHFMDRFYRFRCLENNQESVFSATRLLQAEAHPSNADLLVFRRV